MSADHRTAVQPAATAPAPGAACAPPALPPGLHWLPADTVPPEPWRNGGGSTRSLLAWPAATGGAGAAGWRLRVSLADITQDGPFSAFDGVQRWFAVVQGGGVRLLSPASNSLSMRLSETAQAHHPGPLCLRPDSPAHGFDGGQPPDCQLLDGPTRDLNLMLRGLDGGLETAVPGQPWAAPAGAWCACLVDGPALLQCGPHRLALPALGLLHLDLLHLGPPRGPVETGAEAAAHGPAANPAAPWCLLPGPTAARAWWLWAQLPQTAPQTEPQTEHHAEPQPQPAPLAP